MAAWIQIILENSETWALATLLLLSLVLPLLARNAKWRDVAAFKQGLQTVWLGQILMGICGLFIIILPQHVLVGFALAISACAIFAGKLRRQARLRPKGNL